MAFFFVARTGVNLGAGCGSRGVAQKFGRRLDACSAAFGWNRHFVLGDRTDESKTGAVAEPFDRNTKTS
jgi:hypothetical protein